MVDKSLAFLDAVIEILLWGQLVCVPSQIHVQGRDCGVEGICLNKDHESSILGKQSIHRLPRNRTMQPINAVHLVNEDALADDSSTKLKRKDGGILPVTGHHFADCKTLLSSKHAAFES